MSLVANVDMVVSGAQFAEAGVFRRPHGSRGEPSHTEFPLTHVKCQLPAIPPKRGTPSHALVPAAAPVVCRSRGLHTCGTTLHPAARANPRFHHVHGGSLVPVISAWNQRVDRHSGSGGGRVRDGVGISTGITAVSGGFVVGEDGGLVHDGLKGTTGGTWLSPRVLAVGRSGLGCGRHARET